MAPGLRRKAKLLRKLKPDDQNVYDHWWRLCVGIAECEGKREDLKEFLTVCGIQKEYLHGIDMYMA